jgi:hypothetical protein
MRVPQSRCWLVRLLHFVAAQQRGLSLPIPYPLASVVVHLRLLLRLPRLGGRLRIRVNCNYRSDYQPTALRLWSSDALPPLAPTRPRSREVTSLDLAVSLPLSGLAWAQLSTGPSRMTVRFREKRVAWTAL